MPPSSTPARTNKRGVSPPSPQIRRPKKTPNSTPKPKAPLKKATTVSNNEIARQMMVNRTDDPVRLQRTPPPGDVTDDDDDPDPIIDSDDEDVIRLFNRPKPRTFSDPNDNPDLSDSAMSKSPSPLVSRKPFTRRHPVNVASHDPSVYFQKTIETHNVVEIYKPGSNGTIKMRAPTAYWKWPNAEEYQRDIEQKVAKAALKGVVDSAEAPPVEPLTLTGVPLRIQKKNIAPHISWIQRKIDEEKAMILEAAESQRAKTKLKAEIAIHRAKMQANKDDAIQAIARAAHVDEDGFIRIKGTRKRTGAGIDLDEDRIRRKYRWRKGIAPLRGKKKQEYDRQIAAKLQDRQERLARGEQVTESEPEPEEPVANTPVQSKPARKQKAPRKRPVMRDTDVDSDCEEGLLDTSFVPPPSNLGSQGMSGNGGKPSRPIPKPAARRILNSVSDSEGQIIPNSVAPTQKRAGPSRQTNAVISSDAELPPRPSVPSQKSAAVRRQSGVSSVGFHSDADIISKASAPEDNRPSNNHTNAATSTDKTSGIKKKLPAAPPKRRLRIDSDSENEESDVTKRPPAKIAKNGTINNYFTKNPASQASSSRQVKSSSHAWPSGSAKSLVPAKTTALKPAAIRAAERRSASNSSAGSNGSAIRTALKPTAWENSHSSSKPAKP